MLLNALILKCSLRFSLKALFTASVSAYCAGIKSKVHFQGSSLLSKGIIKEFTVKKWRQLPCLSYNGWRTQKEVSLGKPQELDILHTLQLRKAQGDIFSCAHLIQSQCTCTVKQL